MPVKKRLKKRTPPTSSSVVAQYKLKQITSFSNFRANKGLVVVEETDQSVVGGLQTMSPRLAKALQDMGCISVKLYSKMRWLHPTEIEQAYV